MFAAGDSHRRAAADRGECDVAPIHFMDTDSGEYNKPFLRRGWSSFPVTVAFKELSSDQEIAGSTGSPQRPLLRQRA